MARETDRRRRRRRPWIFWVFVVFWRLACGLVDLFGRFVAIALGAIIIVIGLILSCTVVGAIIGIPLMLIGVLLVVCALWRRRRGPRR